MIRDQKDNLFLLIKSLTKSEKRQFKLYVGRIEGNVDAKFLNLFNFLDKASKYNEKEILSTGFVKKQQLANVKAHLYKQILISLKLNPLHQNIRSQVKEQTEFATILYHKGLYKQSLKILDKAKELAFIHEEKNLVYEILELEKLIESQYITRSIKTRADDLIKQSNSVSELNRIAGGLSNLSLKLYSIILKSGYVKSDEEKSEILSYFNANLPEFDFKDLGFREKLWLYNSYLWLSFLVQDFTSCYKYSKKWVELFQDFPKMISLNPVWYLKGNQYLLESLFFIQDHKRFELVMQDLEANIQDKSFPKDDNIEGLVFLYLNTDKLNLCFMKGLFDDGLALVDGILKGIKRFKNRIDEHHVMVFYYKIASLYFCVGNNKECIRFLNYIINNKSLSMREDLMCFSRILSLFAHYDAGMDYHLETQLRSTYKFLMKMNELNEVQTEIITFLKQLPDIYPHDVKEAFETVLMKLKKYENDPYERRAFLYLDIISWLESKIANLPVDQIIRNKFLQRNA
ncbi:hypothetical protein LB456_02800 [Psychroflexus sp. CAK57W]|uniref:hypothetical protein n=1 Tax=Psychroflexus curvus TaxID=2873595 RepID=UPI001CCBD78D|nr:hypothetical protein [Psychroflexus curvus]MBZ9626609.1 hypothetical protein [Psychroflexus curvus]MBZ9786376.1 hypothetical protein [Psychroflexus curvus]